MVCNITYKGKKYKSFNDFVNSLRSDVARGNIGHTDVYSDSLDSVNRERLLSYVEWAVDNEALRSIDMYTVRKDIYDRKFKNSVKKIVNNISRNVGVSVHYVYDDRGRFGWYKDGMIYYNDSRISLDTYIHEFGHLWALAVKKLNNELYNTLLQKINFFMENNDKFRSIVEKKLEKSMSDNLDDEKIALAIGFVSVPVMIEKLSEESNISVDEVLEIYKSIDEDIVDIYNIVSDLISDGSIKIDNVYDLTLYEFLKGVVDSIVGGKNVFGLDGYTFLDLLDVVDYSGYFENVPINVNTAVDLANSLYGRRGKKFSEMTDAELKSVIQTPLFSKRYVTYSKIDKKHYFNMYGKTIEVLVDNDGVIKSGINEIIKAIRDGRSEFIKKLIAAIEEVGKEGNINNKMYVFDENFKTQFGNNKYTYEQKEAIFSAFNANEYIHYVGTFREFIEKYKDVFKISNDTLNMFIDFNPIIVLHSDPTKNGGLTFDITIVNIEKQFKNVSATGEWNIFRDFGITDSEMKMLGVFVDSNTMNEPNIISVLLLYSMLKDGNNVVVRNINSIDVGSNTKVVRTNIDDTVAALMLMKNYGKLKSVTYDNFSQSLKDLFDYIDSNKDIHKQSFVEILKSFMEDNTEMFHESAGMYHFFKRKFYQLKGNDLVMLVSNMMRYIISRKGLEVARQDNLYKLLAKVLLELKSQGYNDVLSVTNNTGNSRYIKSLLNAYVVNSSVYQLIVQQLDIVNMKIVNDFRKKFREEFTKLLEAVIKEKAGVGRFIVDKYDSVFKSMFKTLKTDNGETVIIPYLHNTLEDKETKELYDKGEITDNQLKLANYLLDAIYELLVENEINYLISNGMKGNVNIQKIAEDNVNARWNRRAGQVPVMHKSLNALIFGEGNIALAHRLNKEYSEKANNMSANEVLMSKSMNIMSRYNKFVSYDDALAQVGVSIVDNKVLLVNKDLQNAMSTNVEVIGNIAIMGLLMQKYYYNEIEMLYEAGRVYLNDMKNFTASERGREHIKNIIDMLEEHYKINVLQVSRGKEVSVGTAGKKVVSIDTAMYNTRTALSYLLISYSPRVALKSLGYNFFNSLFTGLSNIGTDLPTVKHFMLAYKEWLADEERVRAWTKEYMVANASIYEVLNRAEQNLTKRYSLNTSFGNIMNAYTDELFRSLTMVAFMIKDGTWEAHKYDRVNRRVYYDEKADRSMYDSNGNLTDKGAVKRAALIRDLIDEGIMTETDNVLPRGYAMWEINSIKTYTDKHIIATINREHAAQLTYTELGKHLSLFRRFFYDMLANYGLGANSRQSVLLSFRKIIKQGDSYISVRDTMNTIGILQSMFLGLNYMFNKNKIMAGMNEKERERFMNETMKYVKINIRKGLMLVFILLLLGFLFGEIDLDDLKFWEKDDDKKKDKEKKKYFINLYRFMLDFNIIYQADNIYDALLPTYTISSRMVSSVFSKPLNVIYYLPIIGKPLKDTDIILEYFDEDLLGEYGKERGKKNQKSSGVKVKSFVPRDVERIKRISSVEDVKRIKNINR